MALACGLVPAFAGLAVSGLERLVLPYDLALLVLFFVSGRVASKWAPVRIDRRMDPVLSVRVQNVVTVDVESDAPVSLRLRVRDEAPESFQAVDNEFELTIEPGDLKTHAYRVKPSERGEDTFRGTYVRYAAPLGLATVEKWLDTAQPVRVYPNVRQIRDFELLKQKGRLREVGLRRARIRGLGTDFESLREYNDDDFRFVDWKSTARRGKLVVRNYEQERNQAVIVVLDLGRHMLGEIDGVTKLDHALDAALMLLHAAERAGDMVGLYAFNDAVRGYVAPKRGRAQVAAILSAAHDLVAEPVQPHYGKAFSYLGSKWKRRSLVVFFTDAENDDQARELVSALDHVQRHHLLMVVRVRDPRLKELLALRTTDSRTLALRASATWYQADRQEAETILATAGFHTVESEPQDLAATLVTAYLRVKERALL